MKSLSDHQYIDELAHSAELMQDSEYINATSTIESVNGAEWRKSYLEKLRSKNRALYNRTNRTKLPPD